MTNNALPDPAATSPAEMLANRTYRNAAAKNNMAGVHQNNATVYARAYYSTNTYTVPAGKYLPKTLTNGNVELADCPAGYYCAGLSNPVSYDSTSDQGLVACSTLGDHTYVYSAVGNSADTGCYKECNIANAVHSSVSGGIYYGSTSDACEVTACDDGYHPFSPVSQTVTKLIGWKSSNGYFWAASGMNNGDGGDGSSYFSTLVDNYQSATNVFVVDYDDDAYAVAGASRCSSVAGTFSALNQDGRSADSVNLQSEVTESSSGTKCWCKLNKYLIASTSAGQVIDEKTTQWAYLGNLPNCANGTGGSGGDSCAKACAEHVAGSTALRGALFASAETKEAAECRANTINIVWQNATGNTVNSVTYGGGIFTPEGATQIPGKTFLGWKFQTTEPDPVN